MNAELDQPARVAVVCVTWNRHDKVVRALDALEEQVAGRRQIDVVVVDNASTDGTIEVLKSRWRVDGIHMRESPDPFDPRFRFQYCDWDRVQVAPPHLRFASFTIIRNKHNLGGCGGFNTGLAYVRDRLAAAGNPPDFVWLLDDDAVVAPDALVHLIRAMAIDPRIAIAGSRMLRPRAPGDDEQDPLAADRTTETTVYIDPETGLYTPAPGRGHPLANAYAAWRSLPDAERLVRPVDVDVTAACSLLARWSAVEEVGLWDPRFFIAGDDADWCLRMRRAGYRVVCAPAATVEHELWTSKRNAGRDYCRRRNLVWVWRRWFDPREARRVTRTHFARLFREARRHADHRRAFEARATLRTILDAVQNRGGRLDLRAPGPMPLRAALREAGVLDRPGRVAVAAGPGRPAKRAGLLVGMARKRLGGGRSGDGNETRDPGRWRLVDGGLGRRGRLLGVVSRPPKVVIVPTHACVPIVRRGGRTVRIAGFTPLRVTLERGGLVWRLRFEMRYWKTRIVAAWSLLRMPEPPEPPPGSPTGGNAPRDRAPSGG